MKTIYKYHIPVKDYVELKDLPFTLQWLRAKEDSGNLYVWALVNKDSAKYDYHIRVIGTGNPITEDTGNWRFIDTVKMRNGLVWHIFEVI